MLQSQRAGTYLAEGGLLSFFQGEGEGRLLLAFNNQKASKAAFFSLAPWRWSNETRKARRAAKT